MTSQLRTRTAILGAVVAALLLGGLAASNTSATLLSPPPGTAIVPAILVWVAVLAGVVVVLGDLPMPSLVRRLLAIAILSTSVWSLGTMMRALHVTLAFARGEGVEEEATLWQVGGLGTHPSGARSLAVSSLEYRRSVSVPFDEAAVAEIAQRFTCLTLPVERTAAGVERVRLPEGELGMDDLVDCPAVQRIIRK